MPTDNQPKLVLRETKTNPQTGESETWEHETGNSTPVSKTLPNVTVTAPVPEGESQKARAMQKAEAEANADKNRAMREANKNGYKTNINGPLSKYGDEYKTIWESGGYKPRRFERPEPEGKIEYRRQRKNPDTGEWEDVE